MKVGLAAAGSGGHVFPALAVADALVTHGLVKDDIIFFGGDRMEAQTVPAAGYPFVEVDIQGIRRSLSTDNLVLPIKISRATKVITDRIRSEEIGAMIVFGGYVSGPAGRAASKADIPLVIHEQNAVPGVANRLLAPAATTVYLAFEPARTRLKRGVVVGNPLRASFEQFDRSVLQGPARHHYGIAQDATVLGVFGGSLGAAALNDITRQIAADESRTYAILHMTGEPHFDQLSAESAGIEDWTVLPFEEHMERFYAASDVVISRAGAMTVSELHATATPAVVVPLPAGKGYQALNAQDLVESGAAVVIPQDHRSSIIEMANELLGDPVRREAMTKVASESRHGGAADIIARHVLEITDV